MFNMQVRRLRDLVEFCADFFIYLQFVGMDFLFVCLFV